MPQIPTRIAIYGDAGRGNDEQKALGQAMALRHAKAPFRFAVSTGDNQYDPTSPGLMQKIFEEPFAPLIASGVPFYQTIGNHDMDENRIEEHLAYSRQVNALAAHKGGWVLPAENYVVRAAHVRMIVLNVTEALSAYSYPHRALAFAREALSEPSDDWTILVFHYHLWSTGLRGDHEEMKEAFLPFLECFPVDFVFCGHEHHAEMFAPWQGVRCALVGNGSDIRAHIMPSEQASLFRTNEIGFAELTLDERLARLAFIDRQGREIWAEEVSKNHSRSLKRSERHSLTSV